MDLRGFFDSFVVAISNISARPSVIINKLLPRPEAIATPYEPLAAAYNTIAISGSVVATLKRVLPTNFAPYLNERCSAPQDNSQLEKVNSASQSNIITKLLLSSTNHRTKKRTEKGI